MARPAYAAVLSATNTNLRADTITYILAAADSNKDGLLSLPELNGWLNQSFSRWDLEANGSLNAQELNVAFSQLAAPDAAWTAPVPPFFGKAGPKAM
jgi:hypothetical protein